MARVGGTNFNEQGEERLQRAIARAGVASRRASEELIEAGRVKVNGKVVTQLGTKINPATDKVTVDDQPIMVKIQAAPKKVYILLNKPSGYLSTVSDPQGRPTIMDLVTSDKRLYPVGRLDADTEGLIILTNDGPFANQLMHPNFGVEKEYEALVEGFPQMRQLDKLRKGVPIPVEDDETGERENHLTAPADVRLIRREGSNSLVRIVIKEGKKRQVRLMMDFIGHPIISLKRVRYGSVRLDDLPSGRTRPLTSEEVRDLVQAATTPTETRPRPTNRPVATSSRPNTYDRPNRTTGPRFAAQNGPRPDNFDRRGGGRGRPEGGSSENRPSRPAFGNPRPQFGGGRPSGPGRAGNDGNRPPFGSDRPARPPFGNPRPQFGGGNSRPAADGGRPAFGNNRPAFGGGRPGFGNDRPARPGFGNGPRPDNNRFGDSSRPNNNRFEGRDDRPGGNRFERRGDERPDNNRFERRDDRYERPGGNRFERRDDDGRRDERRGDNRPAPRFERRDNTGNERPERREAGPRSGGSGGGYGRREEGRPNFGGERRFTPNSGGNRFERRDNERPDNNGERRGRPDNERGPNRGPGNSPYRGPGQRPNNGPSDRRPPFTPRPNNRPGRRP